MEFGRVITTGKCQDELGVVMVDEELTKEIISAAIEVHRYWGPGLYEDIYERSLCAELKLRGLNFKQQLLLPLVYKGEKVGDDLRLDLLVENRVVVEIKHVAQLGDTHTAQALTYMKLTDCRVGLLLNFKVSLMKNGIKRLAL